LRRVCGNDHPEPQLKRLNPLVERRLPPPGAG
jgi:hypothetical protein